jgi:CheY-like chemotaxis protein
MPDRSVILIVDDSDDDILLIRNAFQRANIRNPLFALRDGDEAISYLKGEGKFSNRAEYPLPDLILLDLKMPRVTGFEVLQWIRSQPGLASLRVLVLTTSDEIKDVNKAYALGANSFLIKPLDLEDFTYLSQVITDFWLRRSQAPQTFRPAQNGRKESNDSKKHGGPADLS